MAQFKDLRARDIDLSSARDIANLMQDKIDAGDATPRDVIEKMLPFIVPEIDAVVGYSNQFIDFITDGKGFDGRKSNEWIYVICGLLLTARSMRKQLLNEPQKGKVKDLNSMVKDVVGTTIQTIKTVSDDDV